MLVYNINYMICKCIHATWLLFHIIPPADSKIARGTSQRWKGNTEKMFINRRFKAGARLEQLHVELTKARNLHVFMRCSCGIWFAPAKTCSFPWCPCRQQKMSWSGVVDPGEMDTRSNFVLQLVLLLVLLVNGWGFGLKPYGQHVRYWF